MKISEKLRKDIINERKNILNEQVASLIPEIKLLVEIMEANEMIVENKVKLPNIAITVNNKLIELQHEFERAGLSFFIESDSIESNTVGDAIIQKMISLLNDGVNKLEIHEVKSTEVMNNKMKKLEEIKSLGAIKQFFFRIKCFFNPNIINDIKYYTSQEAEELNGYLDEYIELDNKIFSYNLHDNVVESLIEFIKEQDAIDTCFFKTTATCTLEKLGLKHLIPELNKEFEKYSKQLSEQLAKQPSWHITPKQMEELLNYSRKLRSESKKNIESSEKEH